MKRFKLIKYVNAEQMFQSNAEQIVGKIDNLIHGNDGYLVDDPDNGVCWVPKSIFEQNAIPADSHSEIINMMIAETTSQIEELKAYTKNGRPANDERARVYMAIRHGNQYLSNLQKILNCLKK